MRLDSFEVENFRSLEKTRIPDLKDVNVFVGPNNAGKSSVLGALKLTADACQRNPLDSPGRFGQMVFRHEQDLNVKVTLEISLSPQERRSLLEELFASNRVLKPDRVEASRLLSRLNYHFVLSKDGVVEEALGCSDFPGNIMLLLGRVKDKDGSWIETYVQLQEACNNLTTRELESSIVVSPKTTTLRAPPPDLILLVDRSLALEHRIMQMVRQYVLQWRWLNPSRLSSTTQPPSEQAELSPNGDNLPTVLNTINSNDPDLLVRIKEEVHKIIPDVTRLLAPLTGGVTTILTSEEDPAVRFDPIHMSFGIQQTIILVTRLLTMKTGSLLIMEEPENHLHARSQRRLLNLLRRHSSTGVQIFLTTHSSILTGCSDDMQTYLVRKREGITSIRPIEEPSELRLVKAELGHRNVDFYSYDYVVLVEGETEDLALPLIADSMGYDFVGMGVKIINIRGKGKVSKIEEYLRYLKDSDVVLFVVADRDKQVAKKIDDWVKAGLLSKENYHIWDLEFEDSFGHERIVKAMRKLAEEHGFQFDLDAEQLKQRCSGKSVVKALSQWLHERHLPELDKPELGEDLALVLKEEIQEKKMGRKETDPEKVIRKIVMHSERALARDIDRTRWSEVIQNVFDEVASEVERMRSGLRSKRQ